MDKNENLILSILELFESALEVDKNFFLESPQFSSDSTMELLEIMKKENMIRTKYPEISEEHYWLRTDRGKHVYNELKDKKQKENNISETDFKLKTKSLNKIRFDKRTVRTNISLTVISILIATTSLYKGNKTQSVTEQLMKQVNTLSLEVSQQKIITDSLVAKFYLVK